MPGKVLKEVLDLLPAGVDQGDFVRAWRMSELELPACVQVCGEGCGGCKVAGGLYLRCGRALMSGSEWCKSCHNNMVSDGRPKHGIFKERVSKQDWRTDEGKSPITYMQYLKKNGMTRADGEEFLGEKKIPDSEWELPTRGRRGSAVSDTSSEGGRGKFTARFLPTDEYNGISPPKDKAHYGKNGKILRVYKYSDGNVRKISPSNWTDDANEKFTKLYGGDGASEGFEEAKKKRGKKHANDAALEQMDEMRAMLEKLTAERDALLSRAKENPEESKGESKGQDEATVKAQKKAKLAADKKKKKAEKAAKKKAEAAAALKKQQEELARQQEELQKQMAAEMSEEDDSDEAFDSDEEEVVFNGYEYNGTLYHHDEDTGELSNEDGEYFGYIDDEGVVHEGDSIPE